MIMIVYQLNVQRRIAFSGASPPGLNVLGMLFWAGKRTWEVRWWIRSSM